MNLQEIYDKKKRILNEGYMDFYNTLRDDIDNDKDFNLSDDEEGELIVDLMLSNVLGEVITYNEVIKLINNNKLK